MSYVEQFTEVLRQKNMRFALLDGQLFIRYKYWITPIGPSSQNFHLDKRQCRELLRKLGGLWVQWTDGFASSADSEWYAVVCRKHLAFEGIADGKRRSELRRALRECEVRKVEAEEISVHGYETYLAALAGYGVHADAFPTAEEFARRVMTDAPLADTRHQWAVYCDGRLVGFSQNLVYEKLEVNYADIKLHPEYLNRYSSYALIYRMNEYYLEQEGFGYVNDGFRSISHDTNVQEFLIKKFGFEKAYTGLHLHYRFPLGQLLRMAKPFRRVLTKAYPKAYSLFELDRMKLP